MSAQNARGNLIWIMGYFLLCLIIVIKKIITNKKFKVLSKVPLLQFLIVSSRVTGFPNFTVCFVVVVNENYFIFCSNDDYRSGSETIYTKNLNSENVFHIVLCTVQDNYYL